MNSLQEICHNNDSTVNIAMLIIITVTITITIAVINNYHRWNWKEPTHLTFYIWHIRDLE